MERRAIPESVEIFEKQAAATRVGLGKAAKYGGFWQFHLAILEFATKGSGQTETLAETRAVHTEGKKGCDFCRTSYNLVIKL